jgi:hypothetical protein
MLLTMNSGIVLNYVKWLVFVKGSKFVVCEVINPYECRLVYNKNKLCTFYIDVCWLLSNSDRI